MIDQLQKRYKGMNPDALVQCLAIFTDYLLNHEKNVKEFGEPRLPAMDIDAAQVQKQYKFKQYSVEQLATNAANSNKTILVEALTTVISNAHQFQLNYPVESLTGKKRYAEPLHIFEVLDKLNEQLPVSHHYFPVDTSDVFVRHAEQYEIRQKNMAGVFDNIAMWCDSRADSPAFSIWVCPNHTTLMSWDTAVVFQRGYGVDWLVGNYKNLGYFLEKIATPDRDVLMEFDMGAGLNYITEHRDDLMADGESEDGLNDGLDFDDLAHFERLVNSVAAIETEDPKLALSEYYEIMCGSRYFADDPPDFLSVTKPTMALKIVISQLKVLDEILTMGKEVEEPDEHE